MIKKDLFKLLQRVNRLEIIKINFLQTLKLDRFQDTCELQKTLIKKIYNRVIGKKHEDNIIPNSEKSFFSSLISNIKKNINLNQSLLNNTDKIINIYETNFSTKNYNEVGKIEKNLSKIKTLEIRG